MWGGGFTGEDTTKCRRQILLGHFGEGDFDRSACNPPCDNCHKRAQRGGKGGGGGPWSVLGARGGERREGRGGGSAAAAAQGGAAAARGGRGQEPLFVME